MPDIRWDILANAPNAGEAVAKGFERGQQFGRGLKVRHALADYFRDPENGNALATIASEQPELGMKLMENNRQIQSRNALADYITGYGGSPNLSSSATPYSPHNALSPGSSAPQPPALTLGGIMGQNGEPNTSPPSGIPAPMGTPSRASSPAGNSRSKFQGPAWEKFVRSNPEQAMKVMLQSHQIDKAQNQALTAHMDTIARLTQGVTDQASYTAALQEAQGMGLDVSTLPQEYDPENISNLTMQALSARDYLASQRQERRLEWDIQDDRADNKRADRAVDSLSGYRQGQLSNTRRGQDMTDRRGQRGQDIASRDRQRGQDLGSSDRKRGQDLRAKLSGKRVLGQAVVPDEPMAKDAKGNPLVIRNGQWVPAR